MRRMIDVDALFDYFGNDAIDETTRSNIEYFVREKGTVEAIPKAEVRKLLRDTADKVSDNVLDIVRKEYIPKADYETRLKADMVAMLEDIQWKIDENGIVDFEETYVDDGECIISVRECNNIIQQKINALKGEGEE